MQPAVLDEYAHRGETYADLLIGATMSNDTHATAWFHNQGLHVAALSVNMLHEAVLRADMGDESGIDVVNWPLPYTKEMRNHLMVLESKLMVALPENLSLAMSFVGAMYVLAYIRVSR